MTGTPQPRNTPHKLPGQPSKVAALSLRNHQEKLQKSRQLLEEITATSEGNHGNN